ncbi:hypothetical protein [Roseovarius sp. MMSF_3281]|uniref:hypothetical protein n=1 Tax=Roseovarius sp. MMSF_3281 TaxID=3046694 RepID=UPI002740064C|nr:hypothetical protein [Roseovarius sp. MMSF_3281]
MADHVQQRLHASGGDIFKKKKAGAPMPFLLFPNIPGEALKAAGFQRRGQSPQVTPIRRTDAEA